MLIQISSEILLDFIINSSITFALILLLCVFLFHKIKGRLIPYYLVTALIFAIFSTFAYLIALEGLETTPSQLDVGLLYSFFLILVFFFIYLHYESLSRNKYTYWRIFFMFGFAIICLTSLVLYFFDLYKNWDVIGQYFYFLIIIFTILCFLFPLHVSIKIYYLMRERATLFEIFAVIIVESSNIMFLISEILFFTNIIQYDLATILSSISDLLILLGILFLLSNYLIHTDFLYRLPFPVHYFIIINGAGIQVYNRHIATINIPRFGLEKEQLMSGALRAISSLMQETLGTNTKLRFIDAEAYQIYFSEIPKENGNLAIFTSGSSIYLKKSLNNFAKSLPDDLVEELNDIDFFVGAFDDRLDELLTKTFPYLVILRDENK